MRTDTGTDPDEALHAAIAEASAASLRAAAPDPVTTDWAQSALRTHYGLSGTVAPAADRSGRCFELALPDGSLGELHVARPGADPEVIDFEVQALLHIARVDCGLPVQRPVPSQDGAPWLMLADDQGQPRAVRLLRRPQGQPMAHGRATSPDAVARILARLDGALARLWHVAGEKNLPGDIQRADRIRALLDLVPDATHRALAHQALDAFEQRAKPVLPALRRQPIHNDLGVHALLVDPAAAGEIVGILDFSSIVEAPLVCSLAGTAAWQIGIGQHDTGEDAIAVVAGFAAAYHAVTPLQEIEMRLLPDLTRARLAMDLAIGCWRLARDPMNSGELKTQNTIAAHRLRLMAACSPEKACEAVLQACRTADAG